LLLLLGIGQGLFAAPNTTVVMNSVPKEHRGVGSGMRSTFQNAASLLSIGVFFSIITAGLAGALPAALSAGLSPTGLPAALVDKIAHLPPTAALFAAFLGYNPMGTLLPAPVLHTLPAATQAHLLSQQFFPNLIAGPFMEGLRVVFYLSAALSVIAALAALARPESAARSEQPDAIAEGAIGVSETVAATSIIEEDEPDDLREASGAARR
ncbi:MAG TPA: hypothetical protein VE338_12830, partial [Ktedonobacterales bacterium]|nr:hypothetical protein [Ktedonobacterales bacterium]